MGFRGSGEEGRPSTNGERINECGRQIADRGRRDGRRGRAWMVDEGRADGGGWAFDAGGGRPSTNGERINECGRQIADSRWRRMGFRGFGEEGRLSTNWERINECGRQTADGGGWAFEALGRGQAVHEWGTNKRMWTADRRPRTAGQSVDDGWTTDGWTGRAVNGGNCSVLYQNCCVCHCEERSLRRSNPQAVKLA
jgi:hypothetical protein